MSSTKYQNTPFNHKLVLFISNILPRHARDQCIAHVLHVRKVGKVNRVDLVNKIDNVTGKQYSNGFVHFDEWYYNDTTVYIQNKIARDDCCLFIVDECIVPTFWSLMKCKNPMSKVELKMENRIAELEQKLEALTIEIAELKTASLTNASIKMNTDNTSTLAVNDGDYASYDSVSCASDTNEFTHESNSPPPLIRTDRECDYASTRLPNDLRLRRTDSISNYVSWDKILGGIL